MAEPDWADNPLTKLTDIIGSVIGGYDKILEALGEASAIQLYDRPHDIRGSLKKSGLRFAAALEPSDAVLDFSGSSSEVSFARRYHLSIYSKTSTDRRPIEYLEWMVWKAVAFLNAKEYPGGGAIDFPEELTVESIRVENTAPENLIDQIDEETEGWENVCDIVVGGFVSFATLKAA